MTTRQKWPARCLSTLTLLMLMAGTLTGANLSDAEVAPGRPLCVLGKRVVAMDQSACQQAQHAERRPSNVITEALDGLSLDVTLPLLDVSLLEGLTVGATYRYQVEPSYRDRFFARVDRYKIESQIRPGDWIDDLPVLFDVASGAEIVFVQQFASGAEARSPLNTYLPNRLPLTATNALRLKPGDYVRFEADLNLAAKLGQLFALPQRLLASKVSLSAIASGRFEVHVFRLDQNRVRLKLVGERSRSGGAAASVSPDVPLALFGLNEQTQAVVEYARFDRSVRAAIEKANKDVFVVDYTLDLSHPGAVAAYDSVFSKPKLLNAASLAGFAQSYAQVRDRMVGSVADLDALLHGTGDTEAGPVMRNFKGASSAKQRSIDFGVALRSYDVQRERIYRETFLSRVTDDGEGGDVSNYYLLPSWTRIRERSALLNRLFESSQQSAEAMFVADGEARPVRFNNIGFRFAYQDSLLRASEYTRLRKKIELLLPADGERSLADVLRDTGWLQSDDHRNVSLTLNYFFLEPALAALVNQGYGEADVLAEAIADFVLRAIGESEFPYFSGDLADFRDRYGESIAPRRSERRNPEAHAARIIQIIWGDEIRTMAKRMAAALDTDIDNADRLDAFKALRFSSFYRAIGSAVWIDLVNLADIELVNAVYIELELAARDRESVRFTYGDDRDRSLYDAVRDVEAILNDRASDLREAGDIDSIISRMSVIEAP